MLIIHLLWICSMCLACRMSQKHENSSPRQRELFLCRSWATWLTSLNLGTFHNICLSYYAVATMFLFTLLCASICFHNSLCRNPNLPLSVSGASFSELLPPWPQFLPHPNGQNYKELSPTLSNHKSLQANQCSFWSQYVPVLSSSTGQWLCSGCVDFT